MTNPTEPQANPLFHPIKSVDGIQDVPESYKPDHKQPDDHKHGHHHDYKKEHEDKHTVAGDRKDDLFYPQELVAGSATTILPTA
ncbi:hypothetical protein BGZ93_008047 [Podila epicladia]|nr:hypothetical protein BGZ93_008047 [Podila epicladia]